jgi:hypothetical protein
MKEFILDKYGGKWNGRWEFFCDSFETHEEVGIHPDKMEIIKFAYLSLLK